MKFQINRMNAASVASHLNLSPVLATEAGIMAAMPDNEYFQFQAHSKHSIAPAMKSGVDYEFFTVDKRGKKESSDGLNDGRLLHCLLLERAEFDKRYAVGEDHDAIHSENPYYFATSDDLKSFVTKHNKCHSELVKQIKAMVVAHNSELKLGTTQTKVEDYDKLPVKAKTAQPTEPAKKKIIKALQDSLFLQIDERGTVDAKKSRIKEIVRNFDNEIRMTLGNSYSSFEKASVDGKVGLLNKMLPSLRITFNELANDVQLAMAPMAMIEDSLSKGAKDKALKEYNALQKDDTQSMKICDKQSVQVLVDELNKAGYSMALSELPDFDSKFFCKIINVGGKKSETEIYSALEVLQDIKQKLGGSPVAKSALVDEEEKRAISNQQTLITTKQYEHACRIVDTALNDPIAGRILKHEGNHYEIAMFWNEIIEHDVLALLPDAEEQAFNNDPRKRQVLCKSKLDLVNFALNIIADVKFVSTAEFNALERDAGKWGYHHQDAMYRRGFNKILSMLPEGAQELVRFPFIFIEKDAPKLGADEVKPIRIFVDWYKHHHIERASRMIDTSFIQIERWVSENYFTGLGKHREMDVPVYQVRAEESWLSRAEAELEQLTMQNGTLSKPQNHSAANEHSGHDAMPDFHSLKKAG